MNTTAAVAIVLPLGLILMVLFMIYSNKGAGAIRKSLASILSLYEPDIESGQYNRAVRTLLSNTDALTDEVEKAIYYTLAGRALVKAEDYRQALFSLEIATPCYPKYFKGSYNKFQNYKDECSTLADTCREKLDTNTTKEITSAADGLRAAKAKDIAAWFEVN